MPEAIEERPRTLRNVREVAVHGIVPHDGDDLVVGLAAVRQAQAADRQRRQEDVAVGNTLLRLHTDIERIAVADHPLAAGSLGKDTGHPLSRVGLRDESVVDRTEI